jgi:hypothetical protein
MTTGGKTNLRRDVSAPFSPSVSFLSRRSPYDSLSSPAPPPKAAFHVKEVSAAKRATDPAPWRVPKGPAARLIGGSASSTPFSSRPASPSPALKVARSLASTPLQRHPPAQGQPPLRHTAAGAAASLLRRPQTPSAMAHPLRLTPPPRAAFDSGGSFFVTQGDIDGPSAASSTARGTSSRAPTSRRLTSRPHSARPPSAADAPADALRALSSRRSMSALSNRATLRFASLTTQTLPNRQTSKGLLLQGFYGGGGGRICRRPSSTCARGLSARRVACARWRGRFAT